MTDRAPKTVALITLVCLLTAACNGTGESEPKGRAVDLGQMSADLGLNILHFDPEIRPQDDFYRWVNGGWLESAEMPHNRSIYGAFTDVAERTDIEIGDLVSRIISLSSNSLSASERKIKSLYLSYMNQNIIEGQGLRPLKGDLRRIAAIGNFSDLSAQFAVMNLTGLDAPVDFDVLPDFGAPGQYALILLQSGLLLQNRIYYREDDPEFPEIRSAYLDYVAHILDLAGFADTRTRAEAVFALESRLALIHWPSERNRDRQAQYNPASIPELRAGASHMDWDAYFGALRISPPNVIVNQPDYLTGLDQLMADTPLAVWKDYLRAHLITGMAEFLPQAFSDANNSFFERQMAGIEVSATREERVVGFLNRSLPDILGRIYVDRHFSSQTRAAVADMFGNIRAAMATRLKANIWLDPVTREEALRKLDRMTVRIGHPNEWRRYRGLRIRDDDLYDNVVDIMTLEHRGLLDKLDGPVRPDDWTSPAQAINAFYAAGTNQIVIPAGILQPPFFSTEVDDALNYGAIGGIIGHEIIHAFDDQGRKIDAAGRLRSWWLASDEAQFDYFTRAIVADYVSYPSFREHEPNGLLTLGENIGDLSGLAIAFDAYQRSLGGHLSPAILGFTGEQRFFMGWAQIWKRIYRPEALRHRIKTDVHAPAEFRVNWVLSNLPSFQSAFDVGPGDRLYRAPGDRVAIW